jgi:hypothetical protein
MNKIKNSNLNILLFANINISEIIEIINYYISSSKDAKNNLIINKDFYLEINEELESYNLSKRYIALTKLFKILINTNKIKDSLSVFQIYEEIFNKIQISKAYEYGIFESLTYNLSYLYSLFISYNENIFDIEKCELIFFIKINTYLLFAILYTFQQDQSMINHIKYNSDLLEETILKFIKQYTRKYVPIRILLCLYTIYFLIYTSENDLNNNDKNKDKYLTKQNYIKYLKPEIPLIFLSSFHQKNKDYCLEKFYRRNLIMQQKSDIEMIFISQILKILLITFANSKNQEANELTKDYYIEIILKQYYLKNNSQIFVEKNDNENNNEKMNKMNIKQIKEIINILSEQEKSLLNIINIFNTESIIYTISLIYLAALKKFKKKNLIQFTYLSFLFKDSNGLKVFLALLKQDNKNISDQFLQNEGLDFLQIIYDNIFSQMLLIILKIIFNIVNKIDDFIIVLIECHVPIMLNNILNSNANKEKLLQEYKQSQNGEKNNLENNNNNLNNNNSNLNILIKNEEFIKQMNPLIKKACLKLFKCQIKFLNKAWRQENENILTDIYLSLNVSCDPSDNYLKYKDIKDKDSIKEENPIYFKEEELKNIFSEFHDYNYFKYSSDPSSYENFLNKKMHSLFAYSLLSLKKEIEQKN